MIKTKKQMFIIISVFALILFLGGTTYAWFSYRSETSEQELIAGDIYLHLNEGQEEITLTNVFPETPEEARARNDNYITFSIDGINTSNKTIYYEFILDHGTEKASPKSRYRDQDLRFDLIEINGNSETYLLSNVGYDSLVNQRIYVNTIDANTTTEVERQYKLRMWLDEDVIISDTDPNRTYTAAEYPNKYATIKLVVSGDFTEKYFGYQKVQKGIDAKKAAEPSTCSNITYEEDGIVYLSGTNDCIDFNYVWYSGKLWRITAIYPDGAMKLVTQNNITTIAYNGSNNVFYTDANTTSYIYQWLNEDFYDTLYNASQFIDNSKQWNETMPADTIISTKPENSNMVTSNVGLLNNYEYYNSYRCIGQSNEACIGSSYGFGYLNIGFSWWLLNPYNASYLWLVGGIGSTGYEYKNEAQGTRPSIVIKSELQFTGNGTSSNPYKIVGDKDIGKANDLVNSRLSGEYVKLDNGTSYKLFRIIGVEDNKTKIIAMDYAENNNTRKFATSDSDALWGSGTTADTDTWYEYLNRQTTGYYDTLRSAYGELFDSGLYYLGTSGYNYKLSICANTTTGNTKVCDKTNAKGTFNIGIPRYGEMFAAQSRDTGDMWLMNTRSAGYIWYVYVSGQCSISNPTESFAVRPTLHLKSTVKIISGSGTESDPYVVGL